MLENILHILKIKENKKIIVDLDDILTKENYKLQNIKPADKVSEEELLETAAYAESNSEHNIAKVIIEIYGKVNKNFACEFVEESGIGVKAKYNFEKVYAGNRKLLYKNNIEFTQIQTEDVPIYIAKEDKYLGYILLKIQIDENCMEKVNKIKDNKLDIILISGYSKTVMENIASKLNIDEYYYSLDGNEKKNKIDELVSKYDAIVYKKKEGI